MHSPSEDLAFEVPIFDVPTTENNLLETKIFDNANDEQATSKTTRSGRTIRKPQRF